MMGTLQLALNLCLCCLFGDISASRGYSQTLKVTNGGQWGTWRNASFCPVGSYAIGYYMKIEGIRGDEDDTSLNGIQLICGDRWGNIDGSTPASGVGVWGTWGSETMCSPCEFISGFKLQVEGEQGDKDDTAANYMQVCCRTFMTSDPEHVRYPGNGEGYWGTYGYWSNSCAASTAVCGLRIKVEKPQGVNVDDTALNDVELFCCGLDE